MTDTLTAKASQLLVAMQDWNKKYARTVELSDSFMADLFEAARITTRTLNNSLVPSPIEFTSDTAGDFIDEENCEYNRQNRRFHIDATVCPQATSICRASFMCKVADSAREENNLQVSFSFVPKDTFHLPNFFANFQVDDGRTFLIFSCSHWTAIGGDTEVAPETLCPDVTRLIETVCDVQLSWALKGFKRQA